MSLHGVSRVREGGFGAQFPRVVALTGVGGVGMTRLAFQSVNLLGENGPMDDRERTAA